MKAESIERHSLGLKVDIVIKRHSRIKGRWAITLKKIALIDDNIVWYTDTNFVIRGSKKYRLPSI